MFDVAHRKQEPTQADIEVVAAALPDLMGAETPALKLRVVARLRNRSLASLSRETRIRYFRLERILNGRRLARPDELELIAAALGVPVPE